MTEVKNKIKFLSEKLQVSEDTLQDILMDVFEWFLFAIEDDYKIEAKKEDEDDIYEYTAEFPEELLQLIKSKL